MIPALARAPVGHRSEASQQVKAIKRGGGQVTIGARRGEVIALQWNDVDLASGIVRLDENYVRGPDGIILEDTKTHQMRRVSVDEPTVALLSKHRADSAQSLSLLGRALTDDTWLFSAQPDLSKPRDPSSVTRRYSRLARGLGINTQLKQLRHYSASGVPLQAQARELLASVVGAGAR